MIKSLINTIIFLLIFLNQIAFCKEIKILYKINDSIITSFDIEKEANYLITLNKNLKDLDNNSILKQAQQSLIREKIKKDEIDKFYKINYLEAIQSEKLDNIIQRFRTNLGFETNNEFENYLIENDIDIKNFKTKFVIEQFWNQLIYDKYSSLISINENMINNKINNMINSNKELKSFDLSEIVFLEKTETENNQKYQEILNSIKNINFSETAIIYSISESAKLGGRIGWIDENQISEKLLDELNKIKKNEYTNKITTSGGYIILKINDIKLLNKKVDEKKEREKLIISEKNRILNEYSLIYFKEIENKAYVQKF